MLKLTYIASGNAQLNQVFFTLRKLQHYIVNIPHTPTSSRPHIPMPPQSHAPTYSLHAPTPHAPTSSVILWNSVVKFFRRLLSPDISQGSRDYYTTMVFLDILCFFTIVFGVNSFGVSYSK